MLILFTELKSSNNFAVNFFNILIIAIFIIHYF